MKERVMQLIANRKVVVLIYVLCGLAASVQSLNGVKTFQEGGKVYSRYNNYVIFEKSFEHLANKQDLYVPYPEEHWDLYKYTPAFSVFFGLFSILPDWLGLSLWNLLNALLLLYAITFLPNLGNRQKNLILLIVLIELMTSIQNSQSNGLVAGLIVLSFGFLERNRPFWAAFCVVFSVFVKLFGIVGFALFLFYPKKWASALFALFWTVLFLSLPLAFVDVEQYVRLHRSYLDLLVNDHAASFGYSVMGFLNAWMPIEMYKNWIVAFGAFVFMLPYIRTGVYREFMLKYLMLSSILIWIVIFNHKAESPTFIIAMTGVALWFVRSDKSTWNVVLFASAFILTSLSATDIFPAQLREEYVKPYALKALPCIVIWFKITYDMMVLKKE